MSLLRMLIVVSVLAVVSYSPSPAIGQGETDCGELVSRIRELENTNQQLQDQLRSTQADCSIEALQDKQKNLDEKLEQHTMLLEMLSVFESNTKFQLQSLQSLLQGLSSVQDNVGSVQSNIRQDLARLRTVNLYQSCITETRSCSIMETVGINDWRNCVTGYLSVDPADTEYYVTDKSCDISSGDYFVTIFLHKSRHNVRCECEVTNPRLATFPYSGTCTLTVTKCPHSQNLLA